jgi:hypothetical protein
MLRRSALSIAAFLLVQLSASRQDGRVSAGAGQSLRPLASAPDDLRRAAERAFPAFDALQATLGKRLMTEMHAGGPVKAIDVCREEAQAITRTVAREQGIAMGRTGERLRNSQNRAPGWAQDLVAASHGRSAKAVEPMLADLGDRVGVVRPIAVVGLCTRCHGDPASFSPELRAAISRAYPDDRATGFAEGDLRGFFWAEVPKERR